MNLSERDHKFNAEENNRGFTTLFDLRDPKKGFL
jgi:hypothetical protein